MIKNICKVLIISLLVVAISISNVYAYSDDLFEFDIPDTYGNFSYSGLTMFAKSDGGGRAIILMSSEQEYSSINSVWDLEDYQVKMVVSQIGEKYNIIETDDRAKLGKEKAIKLTATADGAYVELYLLMTKGYIHAVAFGANSLADLDNEDFKMVKESFKLKESSNIAQNAFIIAVIVIVGTMLFLYVKEKKNKNNSNIYYTNSQINNNMNEHNDINNSNEDNFNNQQ